MRTALSGFREMEATDKRKLLIALVLPAGIGWFLFSLLGVVIFTHSTFRDLPSFLTSLMAISGLFAISVALISVFKYPKISKLTIVAFFIGSVAIISGGVAGLHTSALYYISAAPLLLAGAIITNDYFSTT